MERRNKKTINYAQSDEESAEESSDEEVKSKKARTTPKKVAKSQKASKPSTKKKVVAKHEPEDDDESEDKDSDDDESESDDGGENDDDDDAGDDEDSKPSKKRTASAPAKRDKPRKKARSEPTAKQLKALTRLERLEEARKAYKWWEARELPNGLNWRKLEHPGVLFAPPYERHNVPFFYDGEPVELTAEQEEIVTFFAGIPEDGPQLGNPKTREVFKANFFLDFKATLPPGHVIKKMEKCDFSRIAAHLAMQRSLKKAATEEEKAASKKEREGLVLKYGYCLIDGRIEKVCLSVVKS